MIFKTIAKLELISVTGRGCCQIVNPDPFATPSEKCEHGVLGVREDVPDSESCFNLCRKQKDNCCRPVFFIHKCEDVPYKEFRRRALNYYDF